MNKLKSLIVLSLMLFMGGQMMAQSNGAFYLGASFPMKGFADFDELSDYALMYEDTDDCGAAVGFNAGLKWYFNVGVKGLGVMFSLDGFYNGLNANLKDAFRKAETQGGNQYLGGSFAYKSTPKYINVPAMVGVNYMYALNSSFSIYAEAGAGVNGRFITPMETVGTMMVLGFENKDVATQKYDAGFSFAWQAGIGFEVANRFRVGCSIYDLGKTSIKGTETVNNYAGSTTTTNTYFHTFGEMRPLMVLARIGFSF